MLAIVKKIGGHVQPWHTKNVKTYPYAQLEVNFENFVTKYLPKAKLVLHKDVERRNRPDPRDLPKGTALCIADHVWVFCSCGVRGAFGMDQGAVERLVEDNDAGRSPKKLAEALRREYNKLKSADGAAPELPTGEEWWNKAPVSDQGAVALQLYEMLELTQSQIGRRFGVKQVAISTAIRKAGLAWPPSKDRTVPIRGSKGKTRGKSVEQLIDRMIESLIRLNKDIAAAVVGGVMLDLASSTDSHDDNPEFLIRVYTPKTYGGKPLS